jgi:ABC-type sugar transport system ATPase subunit
MPPICLRSNCYKVLEHVRNKKAIHRAGDKDSLLQLDQLSVVTPSGKTLLKHCSLNVRLGCNLLVSGPNGAGKSSLFRVLRGLWPNVRGHISVAGGLENWQLCREIVFVPQQPFLSYGTLMEQIVYPLSLDGGCHAFLLILLCLFVRNKRAKEQYTFLPRGWVFRDALNAKHNGKDKQTAAVSAHCDDVLRVFISLSASVVIWLKPCRHHPVDTADWCLVRGCDGPSKLASHRLLKSAMTVVSPCVPSRMHAALLSSSSSLDAAEALELLGHVRGKIIGKSAFVNTLISTCNGLMEVVKLEYLVEREGGWKTEKNWGTILSLGEQQRMAMARLFFHRCAPSPCPFWGVLP